MDLRRLGRAAGDRDPARRPPLSASARPAIGIVSDLWRFPVKSFGGERVRRAFVGPFGLLGDRRFAVVDEAGEPMSARRSHALLGFRATYAEHEAAEDVRVATPGGGDLAWDDPALAAGIGDALGREVRLARSAVGAHDAA